MAARGARAAFMPVIGFLSPRGSDDAPQLLASFRRGLKDSGFVEGQSVAIEYRFAENQNERLPALAVDLVRRQVTVIAAAAVPAVIAAKAATASIPIVFEMGDDPVRLGFVAGLDRPGGNITGVAQLNREVAPKRLELVHELLPAARVVALLANPTDAASATMSNNMMSVARTLGLELHGARPLAAGVGGANAPIKKAARTPSSKPKIILRAFGRMTGARPHASSVKRRLRGASASSTPLEAFEATI